MIVIARNFGQLGNRLILSANLMAAALEYGVPLLNPSFARYASHFSSTRGDLWCRFPAASQAKTTVSPYAREAVYRGVYLTGRTMSHLRLSGCPFHIVRISGDQRCDLTSDRFAGMARSRRPLLVSGWKFDAGPLLAKHSHAIRAHYSVLPEHQANIDALIKPMPSRSDIVVGVHVRQGDYAKFENGRYFYSIGQYAAAMRRIRDRLGQRQVAFLVCGNVAMKKQDFAGLDVTFGTGHLVEDLYALARTDALIGPPSTFTGWASFYGKVPLYSMQSADETFDTFGAGEQAISRSGNAVAA